MHMAVDLDDLESIAQDQDNEPKHSEAHLHVPRSRNYNYDHEVQDCPFTSQDFEIGTNIFSFCILVNVLFPYCYSDVDCSLIGKVLGSGTFSTVFLAKERHTGYIVGPPLLPLLLGPLSLSSLSQFIDIVFSFPVLKVVPKKTLRKYHAERSLRSELEIQSHVLLPLLLSLVVLRHCKSDNYY